MSRFRSYRSTDFSRCVEILEANCPEYFAPNELADYQNFLTSVESGYEVCIVEGQVRGAFGVFDDGHETKRLNWILLDPKSQGLGIGSRMMERATGIARTANAKVLKIAASHKSAPFFSRFGAEVVEVIKDGWGVGMDRVDMELRI